MSRPVYIYTLSDPDTGEVRYLGKTFNPKSRMANHLCSAKKNPRSHVRCWIKSVLNRGDMPTIEVIDECDSYTGSELEKSYIRVYRAVGVRLTNCRDGGDAFDGVRPTSKKIVSEETKQRHREAALRRGVSERLLKAGASCRVGSKLSEAHKKAISDANRHPKSEQTISRMRAAQKARFSDPLAPRPFEKISNTRTEREYS
jgi:hypothetical protein